MKINKQIAESLASKVAAQIQAVEAARLSKVQAEIEKSKEYKKLNSLLEKLNELDRQEKLIKQEMETVRTNFSDLLDTKRNSTTKISSTVSWHSRTVSINVSSNVSKDDIVNDIMIEAAFAESGTSAEEFMNKIVEKYI